MKFLVLLGRILFSMIFLMSCMHIFSSSTVDQAASHGVPLAPILVRIAGVFAVVGGLSIILGYKARFGAWLIIIFLVPVTLMMHNFWAVSDPMMRQTQQIMFLKNISMLGGAMLIAYFGSGPYSLAR
jgi:putative oxidoreductase